MAKTVKLRRYIIMDTGPLEATTAGSPMLADATFDIAPAGVPLAGRAEAPGATTMTVIDSIDAGGPRLVEMPAEGELSLRLSMPGIKIVPEVFYELQRIQFSVDAKPRMQRNAAMLANAQPVVVAANGTTIVVADGATGAGIAGARIVAFTNFEARSGYAGITDAAGIAVIPDMDGARKIQRAYIYPPPGYWSGYFADTTGAALADIKLERIDLAAASLLLKQLYGSLPDDAGKGVTIAVIDSGVSADHADLPNVGGGKNCVSEEVRRDPASVDDWKPARNSQSDHGTHVAGIAAGRNSVSGFRGVAPGAQIRSYRVIPHVGTTPPSASNYDIITAIRAAVADGCHIINMSLGGGDRDDAVRVEIDRALDAGVILVVAAGNSGHKPVAMPAALPGCVAVSAMGREQSFPKSSHGTSTILAPKGVPNSIDFIADFSNIGPEIDVVGPGVEIVSTLPNNGHGAMDGTSMASPAVAGFAAYLLSANPDVMAKQGAERSRALKGLLYAHCKPQGFGRDYEGFGLPLPPAATV